MSPGDQKTLETMARYGYEQNLTKRLVGLEAEQCQNASTRR